MSPITTFFFPFFPPFLFSFTKSNPFFSSREKISTNETYGKWYYTQNLGVLWPLSRRISLKILFYSRVYRSSLNGLNFRLRTSYRFFFSLFSMNIVEYLIFGQVYNLCNEIFRGIVIFTTWNFISVHVVFLLFYSLPNCQLVPFGLPVSRSRMCNCDCQLSAINDRTRRVRSITQTARILVWLGSLMYLPLSIEILIFYGPSRPLYQFDMLSAEINE